MPFQVMMAPSYLVLDRFRILDTHLAVILPGGFFSTFPVYIMEKFFESIPKLISGGGPDRRGRRVDDISEDWRSDGISRNYDSPASGFF